METAQQIWAWIGNHLFTVVLFLSIFIQITPIKINPWSTIFKWAGKIFTDEACGKLTDLEKKLDGVDKEIKENEKDRIRWEIFNFANSCRAGDKRSRDEFKHIIDLNSKYRRLLEATNDTNGVFELEYEYIKQQYEERSQKNDF